MGSITTWAWVSSSDLYRDLTSIFHDEWKLGATTSQPFSAVTTSAYRLVGGHVFTSSHFPSGMGWVGSYRLWYATPGSTPSLTIHDGIVATDYFQSNFGALGYRVEDCTSPGACVASNSVGITRAELTYPKSMAVYWDVPAWTPPGKYKLVVMTNTAAPVAIMSLYVLPPAQSPDFTECRVAVALTRDGRKHSHLSVTITPVNNFSGLVALTCSNLPRGMGPPRRRSK